MPPKITIQIAGDRADKDRPRLNSLIEQLEALKKTLAFAEREVADDQRGAIYYRVVKLQQRSPATLAVEPVAVNWKRDPTNIVVHRFSRRLNQIKAGKVPRDVSVEELQAYQELAPSKERHIREVTITVDAPAVLKKPAQLVMTERLAQRITNLIGEDEITWGSVTGRLEGVNIHDTNRIFIYPEIGPERVTCTFDRAMREQVARALGHYVQVHGKLHFKKRAQFTYLMTEANRIDALDDDPNLPTLSEMRGIAPDLMGDMDTRNFVDALDEEW